MNIMVTIYILPHPDKSGFALESKGLRPLGKNRIFYLMGYEFGKFQFKKIRPNHETYL